MDYRYSFTDLFSKKVDFDKNTQVVVSSIVIPQIQRPYAQGREDGICTYVRNTFLDELFECIQGDGIFDLNFVYGIIKPNNDEYRMELLDGQQRLTTLFLLHWYLANAELSDLPETDKIIRDCLSKFVYETRTTSTVFCQELANYYVDFGDKTPKEVIRNAKWYFKSFDRDSTIIAMLTMLDAIHTRYATYGNHELHGKLQNLQFYVKSLGLFNLSEELYIKMNARGLQLSPFENFKADLTNFVSNSKDPAYQNMVPLYKKGSDERITFNQNFSIKLDAKWVDIFWKNGAEDFDDAYMSFFSRFFACKYIVDSKDSVSDRDMRADKIIKLLYTNAEEQIGTNEYFGFKTFAQLLKEHPEYIIALDRVLDILYEYDYTSADQIIYRSMLPVWEKDTEANGDDFYRNMSTKMSHIKLIALAAVIEFVEYMPNFNIQAYNQWMRVVWNVIENTNIDSLTPVSSLIRKFSAIIRFISSRMKEGQSFYAALGTWHDMNTAERENRAVLEEIEKAKRIGEDDAWEGIWQDVEKHPYFRGMVTFFYKKEGMTKEAYTASAKNAKEMFDADGIAADYRTDHILIRAVISQFNSWGEINGLYVTENAENNKYLKNILASNDKVRSMLVDVLSRSGKKTISAALKGYIDNAEEPVAWQNANNDGIAAMNMAVKRLRTDVKMYDWISAEEAKRKLCFRIYWYEGHIMFAIPRKQYAKIALDTERARMAYELCKKYGFNFYDEYQEVMYKQYNDCLGNDVWVYQVRKGCEICVGFDQYHKLKFYINTKTKKYAKELLEEFKDSEYIDNDEKRIQLPELEHSSLKRSYAKICNVIEKIFEVIPEIEE